MKGPERPCSIKPQLRSSRNVLQRSVEPAGQSGHSAAVPSCRLMTQSRPTRNSNSHSQSRSSPAKRCRELGSRARADRAVDELEEVGTLRQRLDDVDLRALPHITEADLQELGVSLGHRKIILAAINGLAQPSLDGRPLASLPLKESEPAVR